MADLKRDFKSDEQQGYASGEDLGLPTKKPRKEDSVNGAGVCTFGNAAPTKTQAWIHLPEQCTPCIH